nr:MAG TPA: hypothetical protein [Caudoviricetes sp.]
MSIQHIDLTCQIYRYLPVNKPMFLSLLQKQMGIIIYTRL